MFGLGMMTLLAIFISIQYIPTVKKKIGYTRYSLELFSKNENIRELSDSRRLGSIAAGIDLTKRNPIVGVGYGDIMQETNDYLRTHYPQLIDLELLPHNQYILTASVAGIIGLIFFFLYTIYPIFYLGGMKDFFFLSSQLMFFASFLVEHTLESQIGVALYLFVLLFSMKMMESKTSKWNSYPP